MVDKDTLVRIEADRKAAYARSQKRLQKIRDERRSRRRKAGLSAARKWGLLVVLLIALGFAVATLWSRRIPKATPLSLSSFARLPEVTQVINRPPTLIVVVDKDRWGAMDSAEKQKMIGVVGDTVRGTGYLRAQIRANGEEPLAEWRKGGTAKVLK